MKPIVIGNKQEQSIVEIGITQSSHPSGQAKPTSCDQKQDKKERAKCYADSAKPSSDRVEVKATSKSGQVERGSSEDGKESVQQIETPSEIQEVRTKVSVVNTFQKQYQDLPEIIIKKTSIKHIKKHCMEMKGQAREDCIAERQKMSREHKQTVTSTSKRPAASTSGKREYQVNYPFALAKLFKFVAFK